MLSYTVEKGSVCQGLVRVYSIQSTQFYTLLRELCYHVTDCNVVGLLRLFVANGSTTLLRGAVTVTDRL